MLPPLPDPLRDAWSATRYMFAARGALYEARVGQISPAISRFLTEQSVEAGVFLSAFNPGLPAPGDAMTEMYPQLTPTENAARLEMLWGELGQRGGRWFPHVGLPDDPAWPPEEGAFILEDANTDILGLARHLRQRAYTRIVRNQPATLELVPLAQE